MTDLRRSFFHSAGVGMVSLLMFAGYAKAQPLDCFFKNKSIGHDVTAYVRSGTVECKDPDTRTSKLMWLESREKKQMILLVWRKL